MRTYQQRTEDILSRRDKHIKERKKRTKIILTVSSSALCLVLTAVVVLKLAGITDASYAKGSLYANDKANSEFSKEESLNETNQVGESEKYLSPDKNIIFPNDITDEKCGSDNSSNIEKSADKKHSNEALSEFFGKDYSCLKVPSDLKFSSTEEWNVPNSEDEKGFSDVVKFSFVSDSYKSFSISLSKTTKNLGKHNEIKENNTPTKIGENEVYVFTSYDGYSNLYRCIMSEFSYNGVNFLLEGQFLTDVEFREILEEILL